MTPQDDDDSPPPPLPLMEDEENESCARGEQSPTAAIASPKVNAAHNGPPLRCQKLLIPNRPSRRKKYKKIHENDNTDGCSGSFSFHGQPHSTIHQDSLQDDSVPLPTRDSFCEHDDDEHKQSSDNGSSTVTFRKTNTGSNDENQTGGNASIGDQISKAVMSQLPAMKQVTTATKKTLGKPIRATTRIVQHVTSHGGGAYKKRQRRRQRPHQSLRFNDDDDDYDSQEVSDLTMAPTDYDNTTAAATAAVVVDPTTPLTRFVTNNNAESCIDGGVNANNNNITNDQRGKDDSDNTVMASNGIRNTGGQHVSNIGCSDNNVVIISMDRPLLQFLLHDATLAICASLLLAAYPTLVHRRFLFEHQFNNIMPWCSVVGSWMVVAATVGYQLALLRNKPHGTAATSNVGKDHQDDDDVDVRQQLNQFSGDVTSIPSEIDVPTRRIPQSIRRPAAPAQPPAGYSVVSRLSLQLAAHTNICLQIPSTVGKWETSGGGAGAKHCWSALTTKRGQQPKWQRGARGPIEDALMKRLLRNPIYQRTVLEQTTAMTNKSVGGCGHSVNELDSLALCDNDNVMIEPMFVFRGMDIFKVSQQGDLGGGGGAQDKMSEHPFLIDNGLRGAPSFVVNVMTQWANILLYFEMPDWVQDWDNIVEHEDDADDVKALKTFFNGSDEYKSLRLKLLPFLLNGPMPIRLMAPRTRELTIHCDLLPSTKWHQLDGRTRSDGRYLHPCLELEVDLMATKTLRGFASLVKKYLCTMSVDVAVVIDNSFDRQPDEPEQMSACLAMWRFDKVDVSGCPELPERIPLGRSVRADSIRASMLLQQTQLDLQSARDELEREREPELSN